MDNEDIKKFTLEFFQNLKSVVSWKDDVLVIENASRDFENFIGKKAPYYLVFDKEKQTDDCELMTKGSLMLKAMTNYLNSRGQTTLIKINFEIAKEDLNKFIRFGNFDISSLNKKPEYKSVIRFTFLTTLQYLNEKEQVMNEIYVENGKVVEFNIKDYNISEGKKQDVDPGDIKKDYNSARESLKLLMKDKIQKVGDDLDKKLEKEIARIKKHYDKQKSEIEDAIKKQRQHLAELGGQLIKNPDNKLIEEKIVRIKETIENLTNDGKLDKFSKEEEFLINDETHKHGLNIDHKLINTSIIYYPVFLVSAFFRNNDAGMHLDFNFNPLKKEIDHFYCESCKSQINELFLCSSGHLSCKKCMDKCKECGKDFCKACISRECGICGKKVCRKCSSKCLKCGKYVCKSHVKKSGLREICINCLRRCSGCGDFVDPSSMKRCSCGRELCEKCSRKDFFQINGKTVCSGCSKKCICCGKIQARDQFVKCRNCNPEYCAHMVKCLSCRKQLCHKFKG